MKKPLVRIIVFMIFLLFLNISYASNLNKCNSIHDIFNSFRVNNKITGMALYVHSPKLKINACYLFSGTVHKNTREPISDNNLWQIASITKSYFSSILLQLEAKSQAGEIPIDFNINQSIKHWLPQYPKWGGVTIKQLLNMTSGIYSYTELPISKMVLENPQKVWKLNEVTSLAYNHIPNAYFPPGKGWHYTDTAYVIAGQIIEKAYQNITGKNIPLRSILRQSILGKFKLDNTYYYPEGLPNKLLTRMVHGYNYYTEQDFTEENLSIAGPSGGIISNPKEVAYWIESLFNGKVLPKKQMKEMVSLVSIKTGQPVVTTETSIVPAYSLGLTEQYSKKLGEVWVYEGVSSGYTAGYFYVPKYDTIISYTASIGSIKNNPLQFSQLAKEVLLSTLNETQHP
ncbi:beta-lactamase family protein [Vibrio profundum]|uniref:serine hydrolase domain-containing protein n=1 Tax=Vibrio profundum TaxID=2910247 RepID=UPI003D14F3B4